MLIPKSWLGIWGIEVLKYGSIGYYLGIGYIALTSLNHDDGIDEFLIS